MLVDDLKTLLATQYAFVIKAQNFHWNVEGPDFGKYCELLDREEIYENSFGQYHRFFELVYKEVYKNSINQVAEFIKIFDGYTPSGCESFNKMSLIQENKTESSCAQIMIEELLQDNKIIIDLLNQIFINANEENRHGVVDFVSGRIGYHDKHSWMLMSLLEDKKI